MIYDNGCDDEPNDKKQIIITVVVAALCALAGGLVQWGVDAYRDRLERKEWEERKARKKAKKKQKLEESGGGIN